MNQLPRPVQVDGGLPPLIPLKVFGLVLPLRDPCRVSLAARSRRSRRQITTAILIPLNTILPSTPSKPISQISAQQILSSPPAIVSISINIPLNPPPKSKKSSLVQSTKS